MVTASQLLCGNLTHIWQTRSCKLMLAACAHPGDHPERSMVQPHKLFRCYSLAAPVLQKVTDIFCSNVFTVYSAQKVEAEKHEPVASKTLGLHQSFAVHLHWVRICCQVWTPTASLCYPSGHTDFSYNFPHPFPWACENKEAHVWQLLHAESLGMIITVMETIYLMGQSHFPGPAWTSLSCWLWQVGQKASDSF